MRLPIIVVAALILVASCSSTSITVHPGCNEVSVRGTSLVDFRQDCNNNDTNTDPDTDMIDGVIIEALVD